MKVLVTGGAGYIGSITSALLNKKGYDVVVLDNLEKGYRENVKVKFVKADLRDKAELFTKLEPYQFDAIIHFAGYILAPESMRLVYEYMHNNIDGGLNLLEYARLNKINKFIFSSTCAIYGTPKKLPINENERKKPESVYGYTKHAFERTLRWYYKLYNMQYINLRYFNACGYSKEFKIGENHDPETHLIPLAVDALYKEKEFSLYGTDYETKDGSCVRDYIHVSDLAQAHLNALERISSLDKPQAFNLGTGNGFSNLEIIKKIESISGKRIKLIKKPRRPGDPPSLYADNNKAKVLLGFNPKHSDLDNIISSAIEWYQINNEKV